MFEKESFYHGKQDCLGLEFVNRTLSTLLHEFAIKSQKICEEA